MGKETSLLELRDAYAAAARALNDGIATGAAGFQDLVMSRSHAFTELWDAMAMSQLRDACSQLWFCQNTSGSAWEKQWNFFLEHHWVV